MKKLNYMLFAMLQLFADAGIILSGKTVYPE